MAKKKEKNNALTFFIVILVVFVLVFSFVAWQNYQAVQETESYIYNGFEFARAANGDDILWVTQVSVRGQLYNIPFYFHPSATEDVLFSPGLADAIVDAPMKPEIVYITLDPDSGSRPVVAAVEISRLFGTKYNLLNMEVRSALSRPVNGTDLNVITCADATDGVLVVQFEQGPVNAVVHEGNCVRVQYESPEESIRVADRFAYELLKIM